MDYLYWVTTVDIPRGRHVALRLKHKISRLIEYKVNPVSHTLLCTVLVEEPVEEKPDGTDDHPVELTPEFTRAAAEMGIDIPLAAGDEQ
ncbi:MAG TPA: hypothetical protein VEV45_16180 [Streptosporangiaceae bacterium]|nr:hypothetical protein [Streptosporangiaceae bacterium]